MKFLLGYDIGSSSVKATLLDIETGRGVASATSPTHEMGMIAVQNGWAEQDPKRWFEELVNATHQLKAKYGFDNQLVAGIGISYQMHGLVLVDKNFKVLRPSIIWCDSRAVEIGNRAFEDLGSQYCLTHLLNSPGNFTASKLRWVKENESQLYEKIYKFMLPGDYIAMRLTGETQTTVSGLSEGIFWDFVEQSVSSKLLDYYGFQEKLIPQVVPTFGISGQLTPTMADKLGLKSGTPVAYRAGDQPNNAFSLNVLNPGELATTAGTSGVVYGINDSPKADEKSRVNSFAHVNSTAQNPRNGVLLCINGTGILNSWLRKLSNGIDYEEMNKLAASAPIGANGISFLPFGNGAERVLENKIIESHLQGLNFNSHSNAHVFRAAQEGIVFALEYGLKVMREMGVSTKTVRAGYTNMFLSPVFREIFTNITQASIELYNTDGAQGAARGAGIGVGAYDFKSAFAGLEKLENIDPNPNLRAEYQDAYLRWEMVLEQHLAKI